MPIGLKRGSRKHRNIFVEKNSAVKKNRKKINLGLTGITHFISVKSVFAVFLAALGISIALATVGWLSLWLYGAAVTSDFFTTKHIDIVGNARLSRDMVLEYGGIQVGDNNLNVSIADVERKLRETPWVEEVSVKRLLPDRFVIKLKERMPSFWVRKDGQLFYANESGEIIAPVEGKNFLSLPTLQILPGAEGSAKYLRKLLKDIQNGLLPLEAGAIAQITVSPTADIEIYFEDREMRLAIATDDWDGNLSRLGIALGDLSRRRELGSVREARSADGNVWIIRNQAAQQ